MRSTSAWSAPIAAALDEWERDDGSPASSSRARAGGPFAPAATSGCSTSKAKRAITTRSLTFWREEYQLNRRIKRYPKPYVALVDGIVMGGGVGLSAHGARIVAGESFTFAMPEVGIGFFPDVGATWLLPRLPHRAGVYLALTGAKIGAGDALRLGLGAGACAQRQHCLNCAGALAEPDEPIDAILARFAAPAPPATLAAEAPR